MFVPSSVSDLECILLEGPPEESASTAAFSGHPDHTPVSEEEDSSSSLPKAAAGVQGRLSLSKLENIAEGDALEVLSSMYPFWDSRGDSVPNGSGYKGGAFAMDGDD